MRLIYFKQFRSTFIFPQLFQQLIQVKIVFIIRLDCILFQPWLLWIYHFWLAFWWYFRLHPLIWSFKHFIWLFFQIQLFGLHSLLLTFEQYHWIFDLEGLFSQIKFCFQLIMQFAVLKHSRIFVLFHVIFSSLFLVQ